MLAQVAWDYYINETGQRAIAERLGVSNATVSRLLKRARQRGVVQVSIHSPWGLSVGLEQALRERFGLVWAQVVPNWLVRRSVPEALGQAAAFYLNGEIGAIRRLAVGWGRTIAQMGPYAAGQSHGEVVEMVGTFAASTEHLKSLRLSTSLAHAYGMEAVVLSAPAVAEDAEACRRLTAHPQIHDVLERARHAEMAIASLGPASDSSTLVGLGLVTPWEMRDLRRSGAVGEILGRFFDATGAPVDSALDARLVGLGLEDLRRMPRTMVVAAGADKAEALRGALAGRLMTHLVTDEATAEALLERSVTADAPDRNR